MEVDVVESGGGWWYWGSIFLGFLVSSISDSHARPELTSAGLEKNPIFRNVGLADLLHPGNPGIISPPPPPPQHNREQKRPGRNAKHFLDLKLCGRSRASDLQLYWGSACSVAWGQSQTERERERERERELYLALLRLMADLPADSLIVLMAAEYF